MPVKNCQRDGQPGFKWGDEGKCFIYTAGDASSRERARNQAEEQGRAIEAAGGEKQKGFWSSIFENQHEMKAQGINEFIKQKTKE